MRSISYTLAFTFVSAVSFIFLFLAVGMVPYWHSLSGTDIQDWWSGPFVNFSTIMVPIHLCSIVSIILGFYFHRTEKGIQRTFWIIALLGLLVCQGFNFILYGANINPTLQSGTLTEVEALTAFNKWDFYHSVRTIFVCISLLALILIGSSKK